MSEKNRKTYLRKEIYESTLEYFNGDELATEVWINKYCLKDSFGNFYEKNPDDMHKRIAKELARIENKYPNPISEEEIYETLKKFNRIVPQGSPMSGIGNDFQVVSLSNCFVIGNGDNSDSYGGIFKIDQEIAQLQKRRAGVGSDLSYIRPKGSPVKNSALTSTGIVPFMERHSNTTKEVAQDGRRGALMLTVSIKHPDAEDFIDAKLTAGKVTGANVSVRIDDEFMNAVKEDTFYIQRYPLDLFKTMSEEKNAEMYLFPMDELKRSGELNKIYPVEDNERKNIGYVKKIDARKLWNKIIHNAWKSAEPGILFWDTIIDESIPDCYADLGFKTISTNPCVSEDTLILTDKGQFRIVDKLNQNVNVWNGKNFTEVTPTITGYNQKMVKVTFSDGTELKCTPYHGFYTWEGFSRDGKLVKKETKDLKVGDKLEKYDLPSLFKHVVSESEFDKDYYTLGFFAGDGFINRDSTAHISLYGEKKNLLDKLNVMGNVCENIENDRLTFRIKFPNTYISLHEMKKYIPKYQDNYSSSIMSWLAGIIDSDGSRNSEEGSISISSTDKEFLINIKQHVLNVMGIRATVIDEKEGGLKEIKGHVYETNKSYRLLISAYNVKKLYDLGLRTYRVKIDDVNPNRDAGRFITVKSIENIDDAEKVYCFTEKERGRGCFNGIVTANCGEITLSESDSCRLLALNLYGYVKNPFTSESYFDWDFFKSDVIKAQRYMDDIIDLEIEKIDKILDKIKSDPEDEFIKQYEYNLWERIKEAAINGRRTGLGITAEGDMLAALGYRYGTDEANDFSDNLHRVIKLEAYRSSVILAKERGTFPIYNAEREENNPFVNRIKEEDFILYTDMLDYGRRNIALLTIAPTGCLVEDSVIKTDNGDMTLAELFLLNGINLNDLSGLKNQWIDVVTDVYVSNIHGKPNKITKLYWNGESKTKKLFLSDKTTIESTLEHKFLVKINENEAMWKKSCDLKKGDKIIKM